LRQKILSSNKKVDLLKENKHEKRNSRKRNCGPERRIPRGSKKLREKALADFNQKQTSKKPSFQK